MRAVRSLSPGQPVLRALRACFGLLALAAIIAQLQVVVDLPGAPVARFLSFFSTDSNVIASAVLLLGAARPSERTRRDTLRGAAVLFILITAIVYLVIALSTTPDLGLTIPWVNVVMHMLTPVVLLVDWLLVPPTHRVGRRQLGRWLLFPIAYFFYALVRGFFTGWYPYPFLDPGKAHGYSGVLATGAGMLAAMVAVAFAVAALGNLASAPIPPHRHGKMGTDV